MFERLKAKWKVNGTQLFLILCTFAVTGTLTAYISRSITSWVGFNEETFWLWKALLRIVVLLFGYQVIILVVSFFLDNFPSSGIMRRRSCAGCSAEKHPINRNPCQKIP